MLPLGGAVDSYRPSLARRIFKMLSEKFKKRVTYVTLGSFGSAVVLSISHDCGRGDMCAIELPEMWHVEQNAPAPMNTVSDVNVAVSTSYTNVYTRYVTYK